MKLRSALIALMVTSCLALGACTDHLTNENYEKLKAGMTLEEVEAILGEAGAEVSDGTARTDKAGMTGGKYEWTSGDKSVRVTFKNGKLHKRSRFGFDK